MSIYYKLNSHRKLKVNHCICLVHTNYFRKMSKHYIASLLIALLARPHLATSDRSSDLLTALDRSCDGVSMDNLIASGCVDYDGFSGCSEAKLEDFLLKGCVKSKDLSVVKPCHQMQVAKFLMSGCAKWDSADPMQLPDISFSFSFDQIDFPNMPNAPIPPAATLPELPNLLDLSQKLPIVSRFLRTAGKTKPNPPMADDDCAHTGHGDGGCTHKDDDDHHGGGPGAGDGSFSFSFSLSSVPISPPGAGGGGVPPAPPVEARAAGGPAVHSPPGGGGGGGPVHSPPGGGGGGPVHSPPGGGNILPPPGDELPPNPPTDSAPLPPDLFPGPIHSPPTVKAEAYGRKLWGWKWPTQKKSKPKPPPAAELPDDTHTNTPDTTDNTGIDDDCTHTGHGGGGCTHRDDDQGGPSGGGGSMSFSFNPTGPVSPPPEGGVPPGGGPSPPTETAPPAKPKPGACLSWSDGKCRLRYRPNRDQSGHHHQHKKHPSSNKAQQQRAHRPQDEAGVFLMHI